VPTDPSPPPATVTWRAYLVRCRDGSLYCGVSTDPDARFAAHQAGTGARYTRSRGAVALAWVSEPCEKRLAHRLEWRIKRLTRRAKLALIQGGAAPVIHDAGA
jgi:putative endonuclease